MAGLTPGKHRYLLPIKLRRKRNKEPLVDRNGQRTVGQPSNTGSIAPTTTCEQNAVSR